MSGVLQFVGSQRVRHDFLTEQQCLTVFYLFMAALGLSCSAWTFLVLVPGFPVVVASLVAERRALSTWVSVVEQGTWAQ